MFCGLEEKERTRFRKKKRKKKEEKYRGQKWVGLDETVFEDMQRCEIVFAVLNSMRLTKFSQTCSPGPNFFPFCS